MAPSEKVPKAGEYQEAKLWFERKGSVVTIGVTSRAVEDLGDIQSIDFPDEGEDFSKGDVMITIEGTNGEIEVTAPASGVVEGLNEDVKDSPELILEDPLEGGWILKLEVQDISDLSEFADEDIEAYGQDDEDSDDDHDDEDDEDEDDDFDEEDLEEEWEDEDETPAPKRATPASRAVSPNDSDEGDEEEDYDDAEIEDEDYEEEDDDTDEAPRRSAPAKRVPAKSKPVAKKSKPAKKAPAKKSGKKSR